MPLELKLYVYAAAQRFEIHEFEAGLIRLLSLGMRNGTLMCGFLIKGTASPAERCDLGGVKLEKVHEFFQVCLNLCQRSCDNMWLVMAHYEIKVGQILTDPLI